MQTIFLSLGIAIITRQRVIPWDTVYLTAESIPSMTTNLSSCPWLACVVSVCVVIVRYTVYLTAGTIPSNAANLMTSSFIARVVTCYVVIALYTKRGTTRTIIILAALDCVLQNSRRRVTTQSDFPPILGGSPWTRNDSDFLFVSVYHVIRW